MSTVLRNRYLTKLQHYEVAAFTKYIYLIQLLLLLMQIA
jgi:hypothetical protein